MILKMYTTNNDNYPLFTYNIFQNLAHAYISVKGQRKATKFQVTHDEGITAFHLISKSEICWLPFIKLFQQFSVRPSFWELTCLSQLGAKSSNNSALTLTASHLPFFALLRTPLDTQNQQAILSLRFYYPYKPPLPSLHPVLPPNPLPCSDLMSLAQLVLSRKYREGNLIQLIYSEVLIADSLLIFQDSFALKIKLRCIKGATKMTLID